jgi:uncharacterized flavoprotein (TIGR03862 family)
VQFHMHHRWTGWSDDGALRFAHTDGEAQVRGAATVLALGGGSWPVLGSDATWLPLLRARGVEIAPLEPANCGFDVAWSAHFAQRHAGQPLKPVTLEWSDRAGGTQRRQGEFVITRQGVEGSLIYAASAALRETIAAQGSARVQLDLVPGRDLRRLVQDLSPARGKRSLSEHLRRHAGVDGVKAGLLYEVLDKQQLTDSALIASTLKALPLTLVSARPLDEAISSAGGVRFAALDEDLMLKSIPGAFCAGEMIDWEAPTGGYLLTACFASGRIAGAAAARWAHRR